MAPPKGYKHTEVAKMLMRENYNRSRRPRRPLTPEQRANISAGKRASGYHHSQETRDKLCRNAGAKTKEEKEQEEYLISLYSDEEKEPDVELIEDESYFDLYEELQEH